MKKQAELAKNTIIISIGKICTQFMSFFLLPLYTAALTTEEYGLVDLFGTYTSLLLPIVLMQIDQALFRYMIDKRDNYKDMSEIISTAILFVLGQCGIVVVIFVIIQPFLTLNYKWFLLIYLLVSVWSTMMLQLARGFGKNVIYSIGSFLSAATQILCNVLFLLVFKWGIVGMFTAIACGHIVCAAFIAIRLNIFKYIKIRFLKKKVLMTLLTYSIPLIPNALCWWALSAADRLIVSTFLGINYNGLCAVAHKFAFVVITFYNIFNISWTESASVHINDEDRDVFFKSIIESMFKLFSCLCVGIIACMPFAFKLLVNESFNEAYGLIPIYMVASLFNVLVGLYSVVYVALKKTKEIAQTSIFSGIINIVVHLVIIKYVGVYAAPISSAVAFGIMGIYRYIDIQKYVKVKLNLGYVISFFILYIGTCVVYYKGSTILKLCALVVTVIFALVNNLSLIKSFLLGMRKQLDKKNAK